MFPNKQFITVLFHFSLRICLCEGRENPIIHYSLLNYARVWIGLDELKRLLVFFPPNKLNYCVLRITNS